jgi:putative sigma-54 modulation protein
MVVEFTGRQVEIAPAVRALAERKIAKLSKVLPGITHARVIVGAEKRRRRVEVTVHSPLVDLVANELAADIEAALAAVFDKLTAQAKRGKAKRREAKRRTPTRAVAPPITDQRAGRAGVQEPAWDGRPRIIRNRRFAAKPMTLEEAARLVGSNGDGVLVFRDSATRRIGVLFRRPDGNLGLIEPEA